MFVIDASAVLEVLFRTEDEREPKKKKIAQEIFRREVSGGRALFSAQVLREFYVAVTWKLEVPLAPEIAEEAVRNFAELPLVNIDAELRLGAIAKSRRYGFSFWDALIIETAIVGSANRLFTEDLYDGQEMDGLSIENPFISKETGDTK